jgi:hypothetical protein
MLAKIYTFTWLVIAAIFVVIIVTGSMTMFSLVVFGFIAFGMVFMGMMGVLPTLVGPHAKPAEAKQFYESPIQVAPIQHGAHSLRA